MNHVDCWADTLQLYSRHYIKKGPKTTSRSSIHCGSENSPLSYGKLRTTEKKFTEWECKLPQEETGEIKGTSQYIISLDGFVRETSQMLPGSQLHLNFHKKVTQTNKAGNNT